TAAIVTAMVVVGITAGAAQAADPTVRVKATPRTVDPGGLVTVTARVRPAGAQAPRTHRCRALMAGPFGERLRLPARSARTGAPMRWRVRLPLATYGPWQAEVICPRVGFGVARVEARIVSRPPQVSGVQWRYVEASEVWTWAARITNPGRAYDLSGVRVTASFRDATGRVVATDATPDMILPRSSAGWIGGEVDIRDAPPPGTAVSVTATGTPFPFRRAPFQVEDARAAFDPGPAGGLPSLNASARVRNPNRVRLGLGRVYAVAFDPAGALLRAKWSLAFVGLLPDGTLDVGNSFFADETAPGARVEWFPGITPSDPPTAGEAFG
ncbi:MAG: hypothetical protein ACLGG9_02710, partial [Thermoleophilia bacterium]